MRVNTRYFGDINYEAVDILAIPEGLFGFEVEKEYLLIHFTEDDSTLLCLQSLQVEELAFVLMSPFGIMPDYNPQLTKEDMAALALSQDSEITFYCICVVYDKMEDSTINLRCPIAINAHTRHARQIILDDTSYPFKYPLKQPEAGLKEGEHC